MFDSYLLGGKEGKKEKEKPSLNIEPRAN